MNTPRRVLGGRWSARSGALAVAALTLPALGGCSLVGSDEHTEKLERCEQAPDNTELGDMVTSRDAMDGPVATLDELVAQSEGIAVVHTGRVLPADQTASGLGGGEPPLAVIARVLEPVKGDHPRHTEVQLHYDFLGLGAQEVEDAMPSRVMVFWNEVPGSPAGDPLEVEVPKEGFAYVLKDVTHEKDAPCTFRVVTPRATSPGEYASLDELEEAVRERLGDQ